MKKRLFLIFIAQLTAYLGSIFCSNRCALYSDTGLPQYHDWLSYSNTCTWIWYILTLLVLLLIVHYKPAVAPGFGWVNGYHILLYMLCGGAEWRLGSSVFTPLSYLCRSSYLLLGINVIFFLLRLLLPRKKQRIPPTS